MQCVVPSQFLAWICYDVLYVSMNAGFVENSATRQNFPSSPNLAPLPYVMPPPGSSVKDSQEVGFHSVWNQHAGPFLWKLSNLFCRVRNQGKLVKKSRVERAKTVMEYDGIAQGIRSCDMNWKGMR